MARRHLNQPNPSNEDLAQAFKSLCDGVDMMAEELGVMLMSQAPLTQRDQLTVVRGGLQDLTPPDRQWPTAPIASSGVSPQSCTHCLANTTPSALLLTLNGTVVNGSCDTCLDLLGIPFVLEQDPDTPCLYSYSGTTTCGTLHLSVQFEADSISGSIVIAGVPEAQLSFTATAPYNGQTERTTSTSDISVSSCDLTSVTATIEGASAASTTGGITNENIDQYYALLKVLNWDGSYDCDEKTIHGGLAAIFKGPVMMEQIICPDGSCLNCSEVANQQASLTAVTRVGDIRIIQNDDGNYVLQKHIYTDLVAAQIEDLGWQDSYEFPSIEALVETVEYDSSGRRITQTQIGDVFVVGAGSSSTTTVHAYTRVSRFVKNVQYDIFSHLLTEAYAKEIWVPEVGPSAVDIIDPAEPCSGAGTAPSESIGEAELTAGAATLSASATHEVEDDTGTAAMTAGAATLSASATHTPKEYEGTAALTAGAATLNAEAPNPPPCEFCTNQPEEIELTVANVGNGTCSSCNEINQVYTLTKVADDDCFYSAEASTNCGNVTVTLQFTNTQVTGALNLDDVPMFGFHVNVSAPYDCAILRQVTITAAQDLDCDFTNATAQYEGA